MGTQGPKTGFKVYLGPYTVYGGTLWVSGRSDAGQLGDGTSNDRSSPIQIGSLTNWQQITTGINHTAAVKTDGTLWTWGGDAYGQLGDGTRTPRSSPVQVGTSTNWSQSYAGYFNTLALKTDGTLWAWGVNPYGELGNNTLFNYSSPVQVGSLTNWSQISITNQTAAAIKTDGTLWTWGLNNFGQLGNNTYNTHYSSPIQIGSLTNWSKVSAGYHHIAAVKSDGTLWTWGGNTYGQLGNNNANVTYSSPIQIGSLTNWKTISCSYHNAAVKTDGTLWTWGFNNYSQLGNGSSLNLESPIQVGSSTDWSQVSAGGQNTIAIKTDGTLWVWGSGNFGVIGNGSYYINYASPVQVGTLSNWAYATAGWYTAFYITGPTKTYDVQQDLGERYVSKDYLLDAYPNIASSTGARKSAGIWTVGWNAYGGLGNGTVVNYSSPVQVGSLTNWKQIGGNYAGYGAIKTDGTLWTWGSNSLSYPTWPGGNLGNGAINNYSSPVQVGSLTNWKQVCISIWGSGAVKTDGTLWTWGDQSYGAALGNGTRSYYSSPIQVGSLTNWKFFDNTSATARALKNDGTLWAWGYNVTGQIGNGTIVDYSSPVQVGTLTNWKYVNAGSGHTLAIKTDGTLWSWGNDSYGQLGNGITIHYSSPIQVGSLTNWKQVAGGWWHSYAIKTDGTLWAWGSNQYGQLGNGTTVDYSSPIQIGTLTNWKSLSKNGVSNFFSAAIKTDGTLWTWGNNSYGELGNGNTIFYSSPVQVGSLTNWKSISCSYHSLAGISDGYY